MAIVHELINYFVCGGILMGATKKKIAKHALDNANRMATTNIMVGKNSLCISNNIRGITNKWHVEGLGVVLRWSSLHKQIENKYCELLTK